MSGKPLLVTCGLPYTNGPCHIGHLRTYVPADFYVRYMRRSGEEVVFVCGSDNHGTPIVISAEQEGSTPRALSERYHQHFYDTFRRMEVIFDRFGMTDDPMNHETTRSIVQRLIENGYVYAKTVSQSYCPKCKRFLPDRYVEGTCPHCGAVARGDECDQGCGQHLEPGEIKDAVCKICGTKAEYREQEHYFFRLSAFRDFLLDYLPNLRGTATARNYALGWVKELLHDWCITRTLDWGVKFPGRDDLVVYVWVDAPIGYISFTKEWAETAGADWKNYWCGDDTRVTHFIGGDIIYHHCIFWPALLKGAGYGLPYAVVASGMVTKGETERLNTVLYCTAELLRIVSVLLDPIMPGKMADIRFALGIDRTEKPEFNVAKLRAFNRNNVLSGRRINDTDSLFPRFVPPMSETPAQPAPKAKAPEKSKAASAEEKTGLITIEEFGKMQLLTAKVLEAEKVEGADKLLKLQLEVGETRRQVVSGIAQFYTPEEMIGRSIVIVANLKPAKIRGIESEGMLLCAKYGKDLKLIAVDGAVPSGSSVG